MLVMVISKLSLIPFVGIRQEEKMKKINFIVMLAVVSIWASFSFLATGAMAEDVYPAKDITLVCNAQPGGGFDLFARVTSKYIGKYLKELSPGAKGGAVKVKNMAGASGLQAYEYVYDAKPDGYVYGDFNSAAIYSMLYGKNKLSFDPRNFTWLFSLTKTARVLITNKKEAATWEELVAKSKKEPLRLVVAQFGSAVHLDSIYIIELTKLPAKIAILKSGAETVGAVLRGDIDGAIVAYESVNTLCETKEVNALVTFTTERLVPSIPTIVEKGFPDLPQYVQRAGRMHIGPPKLDPKIEALLIAAAKKMMVDPEFLAFAKMQNSELKPFYGKELKNEITDSIGTLAKWGPIFQKYGI
jgi:tripartite-type tricarboxylate transporter receptor subunit TctC